MIYFVLCVYIVFDCKIVFYTVSDCKICLLQSDVSDFYVSFVLCYVSSVLPLAQVVIVNEKLFSNDSPG